MVITVICNFDSFHSVINGLHLRQLIWKMITRICQHTPQWTDACQMKIGDRYQTQKMEIYLNSRIDFLFIGAAFTEQTSC